MSKKNRILTVLLAAAFSGCASSQPQEPSPSENGSAVSGTAAEDALSAYRDILQAAPAVTGEHDEFADAAFDYEANHQMFGDHLDSFAIEDINNDGIPELIAQSVVNFRWAPVYVYTFDDGKAMLLKDPADTEAHGTFEQRSTANGAYVTYICKDRHIHSVWRGTDPTGAAAEENNAYVLDGTTLTATACYVAESEDTLYFSDIAKANTQENPQTGSGD